MITSRDDTITVSQPASRLLGLALSRTSGSRFTPYYFHIDLVAVRQLASLHVASDLAGARQDLLSRS